MLIKDYCYKSVKSEIHQCFHCFHLSKLHFGSFHCSNMQLDTKIPYSLCYFTKTKIIRTSIWIFFESFSRLCECKQKWIGTILFQLLSNVVIFALRLWNLFRYIQKLHNSKFYSFRNDKLSTEKNSQQIVFQMPDMKLLDLLQMLRSPEYTLQRFAFQLEFEISKLCENGVEGLLELFDSLTRLMKPSHDHSLSPPALYRNSVLGIYVRRIIVIFEQLQFIQVVKLHEYVVAEFVTVMDQDESTTSISSPKKNLSPSRKYCWQFFYAILNHEHFPCFYAFFFLFIEILTFPADARLNYSSPSKLMLYKQTNTKPWLLANFKLSYENSWAAIPITQKL